MNKEQALTWWNSMTFENQFFKVIEWLSNNGRNTTARHPHELTCGEISNIYRTQKS